MLLDRNSWDCPFPRTIHLLDRARRQRTLPLSVQGNSELLTRTIISLERTTKSRAGVPVDVKVLPVTAHV
jgi:hypothetical protein